MSHIKFVGNLGFPDFNRFDEPNSEEGNNWFPKYVLLMDEVMSYD